MLSSRARIWTPTTVTSRRWRSHSQRWKICIVERALSTWVTSMGSSRLEAIWTPRISLLCLVYRRWKIQKSRMSVRRKYWAQATRRVLLSYSRGTPCKATVLKAQWKWAQSFCWASKEPRRERSRSSWLVRSRTSRTVNGTSPISRSKARTWGIPITWNISLSHNTKPSLSWRRRRTHR